MHKTLIGLVLVTTPEEGELSDRQAMWLGASFFAALFVLVVGGLFIFHRLEKRYPDNPAVRWVGGVLKFVGELWSVLFILAWLLGGIASCGAGLIDCVGKLKGW